MPCPMMADAQCAGHVSELDVRNLCDHDTVLRWERFSLLSGTEGLEYRECPKCEHLNKGSLAYQALHGFKPTVVCAECDYEYCFYHSDAHPGVNCLAYAVQQRRLELESARETDFVKES